MIQLDNVSKHYGNKAAVRALSLDIAAGELFAFLGPNGAGKTTTIKMMCGLLFPTSGRVVIGGHDLARDGDRARQLLSYVPDQPFLYEKLTGREFLLFIAEMYGMEYAYGLRRIDEVIGLFQLQRVRGRSDRALLARDASAHRVRCRAAARAAHVDRGRADGRP